MRHRNERVRGSQRLAKGANSRLKEPRAQNKVFINEPSYLVSAPLEPLQII